MKILFYLSAVLAIPALCFSADLIVFDHFDDGVLDPEWDITFTNATGWTYQEAGTELTVTDIATNVPDEWSRVTLGRDCKPLDKFKLTMEFSWDTEGDKKAMQFLYVYLRNSAGRTVAAGGLVDCWFSSRPGKWGQIGDYSHSTGPSVPFDGSATLEIDCMKDNGFGQVLWDGQKLVAGYTAGLVECIEIEFGYCYYLSSSIFGTESVDLVSLEGEDPTLKNSPVEISAATGGSSVFQLNSGAANANRNYIVLGSITYGYQYYIPLPGGGPKLYLYWDLFTMMAIEYINTPMFADFLGQANGLGQTTATLNLPPLDPALAGLKMYFACAMNVPWDFASNSVTVDIVP